MELTIQCIFKIEENFQDNLKIGIKIKIKKK